MPSTSTKKNKLSKEYSAQNIKKVEGTDKWRAYTMIMKNIIKNHQTVIEASDYQFDIGLKEDLFTKKSLENTQY